MSHAHTKNSGTLNTRHVLLHSICDESCGIGCSCPYIHIHWCLTIRAAFNFVTVAGLVRVYSLKMEIFL